MTTKRIPFVVSGLDIQDVSDEDLQKFVIELDNQLTKKNQEIALKQHQLTRLKTQSHREHKTVQDSNLDFLVPPSALRPSFAKRYLNIPDKEQPDQISKDEDPDQILKKEEQDQKPKKLQRMAGSFNPYVGSNKRITSLIQKAGDLRQEITDVQDDREDLLIELERLRAILESSPLPLAGAFKHEKIIPTYKSKKGSKITLKSCINLNQSLLESETNPLEHDLLLCSYYLLTNNLKDALELYQKLYQMIEFPNEDIEGKNEHLQDLLRDLEAQFALLAEQYKHLLNQNKVVGDAFHSLSLKMENHLIDNKEMIDNLKAQIAELENQISTIPQVEQSIEDLKAKRDQILAEKEKLFSEGSAAMIELEAQFRKRCAEIGAEKSKLEIEKRQLEENDLVIRKRYETLKLEIDRIKENDEQLKQKLEIIQGKKKDMHEKLDRLQRAGIMTAKQVREVFQISNDTTVHQLEEQRSELINECNKNAKQLKDLKKEYERLQMSLREKSNQEAIFQQRIERGMGIKPDNNNNNIWEKPDDTDF